MTDTQTINFELVSPEEKLIEEPVKMAVIPGTEGELGVGAGHSSFVVALKLGVVQLYKQEGDTDPQKIFIAGGFADVTGQQCTVLAEQATNVNDLDQAALEQELADLTEDLDRAADAAETLRAESAMVLVKAKLSAVTGALVV